MGTDFTSLLRRQILLVTGKGGVGKSTVSAAFALVASRRGNRTLFFSMDRDTSLDTLFNVDGIGHAPRRVHESLWASQVDPSESLVEFLKEIVPGGPLVRMAVGNRVMGRFWRATPSAYEMASLIRLMHLAEQTVGDGQRRWDNVVVDLPSTGHALTLLGVPDTATVLFKVGPVGQRGETIRDLLANRLRTAMVWVTLPEEMPVNETIEFVPRFEESLDITLDHVIVNGVHPEVLDTDEQEAFEELKDVVAADKSELYNLVNCVEGLVVRGTRHRAQIRRLHESIDARILEIPVSRSRGPELVGMVADIIERDEGRQERRPA